MISVERNYEIYDQKLLTIVMTLKSWSHYVEENVYLVKVLTDHNNLREFINVKELNSRQIKWAMKLTSFDFIIVHRSRKINSANASSRHSNYEEFKTIMKILLFTLQNKLFMLRTLIAKDMLLLEKICSKVAFELRLRKSQLRIETLESNNDETFAYIRRDLESFSKMIVETVDCKQLVSRVIIINLIARETIYDSLSDFIQEIIKTLQREDSLVECHKNFKTLRRRKNQIEIQDSWSFDDKNILKYREAIYVSLKSSIREELLKRHHDDALARHFDTEKTQELLSRKFYWSNMINDVKEYVNTCDICQRIKVSRHKSYDELTFLSQSKESWQELFMNFIIDLSSSKRYDRVYDACLVIIDKYIKMTIYITINKTIDASELIDVFWERMIFKFETFNEIVFDRDSIFTSFFWSKMCYYAKMKRRLSTAFHSQTNEQTERQNQTLKHYFRVFCSMRQDDWITLLFMTKLVYHNSIHFSLDCTSFYALYDYHSKIKYDVENNVEEERVLAAKERVKKIHDIREALSKRWTNVVKTQTKYYNRKHLSYHFKVENLVKLFIKNLKLKQSSKKLSSKFADSFKVEELVRSKTYRLSLSQLYNNVMSCQDNDSRSSL